MSTAAKGAPAKGAAAAKKKATDKLSVDEKKKLMHAFSKEAIGGTKNLEKLRSTFLVPGGDCYLAMSDTRVHRLPANLTPPDAHLYVLRITPADV